MPRSALKLLLGGVLALLLLFSTPLAVNALPGWLSRGTAPEGPIPSEGPSGRLQEVAPPGAVQQLKHQLDSRRPQLTLVSPSDDSVIQNDAVELVLAVQDWPVSRDPDLGIGPHVVVQVDDQPLIRLDQLTDGQLRLPLVDLTPGSHRFSAWAAYPWGEAVTAPGASLQGRLHFWQRQNATQPSADASWVVPIPPTGQQSQQPLMLDWLIWNAPLQNLRDGDGRWRIRLSIDGDSFLTDQQEAIWLKGTGSKATTVQVELLNGQGEPLQPVFNNRLVRLKDGSRDRPVWLKARLSEDELERLSGTPRQKLIDPEPSLDVSPELNEEPEQEEGQDVTDAEKDDEPLDAAPDLVIAPSQEPSPALEPETTPESAPSIALPPEPITEQKEPEPEPVPMHQSEPLLRPESSLGGSARELLNPDGRLKQP
ncbi:MAG: hypothetical protein CL863_01385 [Cyanobium sp. RS427]|nr:hypothetical protein [Cyanobium sp. RS427]